MKYLVIGAGMMGSAVAYDLATTNPSDQIVLADINLQQAKQAASTIGPNVTPVRLDVNITKDRIRALEGSSAIISAVSYSVNYQIVFSVEGLINEYVEKATTLTDQLLGKGRPSPAGGGMSKRHLPMSSLIIMIMSQASPR